jgi:hypothetical protein
MAGDDRTSARDTGAALSFGARSQRGVGRGEETQGHQAEGQAMTSQPDNYAEIRNDLESLMGEVQSAALLVTFIVMWETEGANGFSRDFVGALWSVHNLLDGFHAQGDAMVHRMMILERDGARS